MMKKTMIAAALASTVFSGAAMAWTAGGTGGNIEISGNIQVTPYVTPWEVEVGTAATALDANVTKGSTGAQIQLTKAIPILGIRTSTADPFNGMVGINPQISYNGAVSIDGFVNGVTSMTLPVMDADNPTTEIGSMETKFSAAALSSSFTDAANKTQYSTYADTAGQAFWGGVAKTVAGVVAGNAAVGMLNSLNPDYMSNYNTNQATGYAESNVMDFSPVAQKFSGTYGAGIQAGNKIKITLKTAAANDVIKWKASLPITVSYQ